jgi:hypothetical protein
VGKDVLRARPEFSWATEGAVVFKLRRGLKRKRTRQQLSPKENELASEQKR